jgi:hypothetical protein
LQSVNSGSSASLSWQNTFGGGAPTSLLLEVTRSEMKDMVGEEVIARIPVPLSESVTFEGVPDGNYAVAIRAVNAGGVSAAAGAAGVYPATSCGGVPTAPAHLLTYRAGNTIYVTWDRPLDTDSYAATGFLINVTGAFVGGFPVTERTVFATVGAGTYNISVAATNFCGTGAFTPVQSVTIP